MISGAHFSSFVGGTLSKNSTPQGEIRRGVEFLILGGGIRDFGGTLFKNSTPQDEILGGGISFLGVDFLNFGGGILDFWGGIFIWGVEFHFIFFNKDGV